MVELSARAISLTKKNSHTIDMTALPPGRMDERGEKRFFFIYRNIHSPYKSNVDAFTLHGVYLYLYTKNVRHFLLTNKFHKNTHRHTVTHYVRHMTFVPSSPNRLPMPCDGKFTYTNPNNNDEIESHRTQTHTHTQFQFRNG